MTAAQRTRKLEQAHRAAARAAELLAEIYAENRDHTYRLSTNEQVSHYAVGRAADTAEALAAATSELVA